jgi:pimeloyl-ACP methyl ester carboxylesterase
MGRVRDGKFCTDDGVSVYYTVRGSGPPLYVCHGGPTDVSSTLMPALEPLEDEFTLVFHDYRGSGRSGEAPPDSYRFERLADDLEELRCHLGHSPAAVLAHSMGGFVALQFALRHPESCGRLILISTTPSGSARRMLLPSLHALGWRRATITLALLARYGTAWWWRPDSSRRTAARHAVLVSTQGGGDPGRFVGLPNPNARALEPVMRSTDLVPSLHLLRCPVAVIYGSLDAVMVVGGRLFERSLPHAEITVLDGVGHEPIGEAPDLVLGRIRRFAH